MKKFCLALIASMSTMAFASSHPSADITRIMTGPAYPGKAFVKIDPEPSDKASCNTDSLYTYVFDVTTDEGKATLSALLMSYTTKNKVWIGGSGNCTIHGGSEDLSYVVNQR